MLANEIATYLAGQSLGTLGTDIFDVPFPHDAPDIALCVVERPGIFDDTFKRDASVLEEGEFQVISRGSREDVAGSRLKIDQVKDALRRLGPVSLSGTMYYDVRPSSPYFLRYDEEGRPMWAISCDCEKEE